MRQASATLAPPLIGRQHEFAALWTQIEGTAAGRTRIALVAGDPGIGKTCFLHALAMHAVAAGAAVLHGSASQAADMPPYLPVLTALGAYIRVAPLERLRTQIDARAAILATILPEVIERLGQPPPSYPLPPEQARLRLFDAVGAFLATLSREHPLVLILDDLQWADAATLELLCHVAGQQPDARLCILGAYREDERSRNPPLERALVELTRQRLLTTVTLGPLSAWEIAALAVQTLAASIDPEVGNLLHKQCEGNPFFAEEVLLGWQETGAIRQDGGRWKLGPARVAHDGLPPSLALAIGARLARYYPHLAAMEGRFADFLIDRLLGEIETRQGDWPAAQTHLAAAEAVARREQLAWELAHTLEAQAHLTLVQQEQAGVARARELLEQALALVQRSGNPSEASQLQEQLRTLARGQSVRPSLPASLSAREAEVLRHVAAGKSNRAIARALCLSESTVAHHLTSIFTKTGADNRAAATAFALRHNLA